MTSSLTHPRTPRARAASCAAANHRIITREQGLDEGLTRREIDGLLRSGEWVEMHRGVYRVGAAPARWETRLLAAVRAAERCPISGTRRSAAVSHQAAAALHGIRRADKVQPEVTVVGKAAPVLHGVKVHRTTVLDSCDIQIIDGIPVTTGARMLCDLVCVLATTPFLTLLDDTICARVARRQQICDRAHALRPGRPRLARLVALTETGAEEAFRSWLERTASEMLAAAGLPQPRWNVPVHDDRGLIGVVDALWDWIPLIMELEGLRFHTQPAARQRDAERFNRLTDTARVRRFTYRDVTQRPDYVIASLREALSTTPMPSTD